MLIPLALCGPCLVVVETIDFFEEEDEDLPAPLTLREVVEQMQKSDLGAEEEVAAPAEAGKVGPGGCCSPPHPSHFEPSSHGGKSETLVPPFTRGSVSLCLWTLVS